MVIIATEDVVDVAGIATVLVYIEVNNIAVVVEDVSVVDDMLVDIEVVGVVGVCVEVEVADKAIDLKAAQCMGSKIAQCNAVALMELKY